MVFIALMTFAQKVELIFSDSARAKIEDASGSAFMQYSNFMPRNFTEVLIAISGNAPVDSLLMASDTDTLAQGGALFFNQYIRKDFGLESVYSPTLDFFSKYGLYDSQVIKSFIVLSYFQYLKKGAITFKRNKKRVLKGKRLENFKAKKVLKEKARSLQKRN